MIHFLFNGPPSPEGPRFIESETPDGRSINAGEWYERPDGLWELRVATDDPAYAVNRLSRDIFLGNVEMGWWDDSERRVAETIPKRHRRLKSDPPPVSDKYLVPTKMMLMVSELSEAMEGFRKGLMDDHLPERQMIEVEFADAIIRILDCAGYLGLDVGGAIQDKRAYNATREDHKREVRAAKGGKSI